MTYSGFTTPPRARSRPGTSYPRPPRGAVHFGCGGGERGRDRSAPTGDYPVRLGKLEPDPVRDVPGRGGAPEESLDLVPARDGELRGDGAPPAAIDLAEARPHVALELGARPGCQGPRRHGIGDQRDVAIVSFRHGKD